MIRDRTTDPEQMSIYVKEVPLAREDHAITPIVNYSALKVLEGPDFEGCLIHRFPSVKDAEIGTTARHTKKLQSIVTKALSTVCS